MTLNSPNGRVRGADYGGLAAKVRLRGQRTVFLVAHRLSTIRRADRIVVLDRGRVAQLGSDRELMAVDGLYRELAGLQGDDAS